MCIMMRGMQYPGGRVTAMSILVLLLLSGATVAAAQGRQQPPMKACTGGVVFAECFGFNATDGTAALQAALDYAPAHTVWVRNVSGRPWVVRPIFLRSNKTVRFAAGTLVLAKRGEFHAKNDSLFSIGYSYHFNCTKGTCGPHKCCASGAVSNVSLLGERGATLRMWRSDYADPTKYTKAELAGLALSLCPLLSAVVTRAMIMSKWLGRVAPRRDGGKKETNVDGAVIVPPPPPPFPTHTAK